LNHQGHPHKGAIIGNKLVVGAAKAFTLELAALMPVDEELKLSQQLELASKFVYVVPAELKLKPIGMAALTAS
jgi:hypothetical protein